jgi:hypothetical protein
MWRLLLQAGLGFATFDAGRRIARLKRMAVYCAVAGVLGVIGLGALAAALAICLEPRFGAAGARLLRSRPIVARTRFSSRRGRVRPILLASH